MKLAIISTHPIQYYAPLFKLMAENNSIEIKVFYTWGQAKDKVLDKDFGIERKWDIPLLDGYNYQFVENISKQPGSHHYKGIINPTLINDIEQWQANAILIFGWNFHSHLKVLRFFKGKIPIIFRGDSTLLDEPKGFSLKKIARRFFLTWVYKHIDYALYVGKANKAYYKAHGLKDEQLIFAPHAIDNERFATITKEHENFIQQTKQHFQIVDTDITFVFCGKSQYQKNLLFFLNSFNKITNKDIHLILVGNGEYEKEMRLLVEDNSNIHFMPFQNQSLMPAIYRLGDVFCLPSISETWGLAVNEAMVCSKAILVSNKCGCAEDLVQNNINGFIFKSNDANDLTEKLNLLASNKTQLQQMGKNSASIIQDWSFENIVSVLNTFLISKN